MSAKGFAYGLSDFLGSTLTGLLDFFGMGNSIREWVDAGQNQTQIVNKLSTMLAKKIASYDGDIDKLQDQLSRLNAGGYSGITANLVSKAKGELSRKIATTRINREDTNTRIGLKINELENDKGKLGKGYFDKFNNIATEIEKEIGEVK